MFSKKTFFSTLSCLIGAPTVTIGHLDPEGSEILDRKLKENLSIEEIIAFFSNYKPKLIQLKLSKSKTSFETTSEESSISEISTLKIGETITKTETRNQNQILDSDADANTCKLTLNLDSFSNIGNEKEDGKGNILFEGSSADNIPDITVSNEEVQNIKVKENFEKEAKAILKVAKKKRNIFDILDVENLKKNIPFMHPDRETHTFRF